MPELSAADLVALQLDMVYGPYLMRPDVQMLTLDHAPISDLSGRVLDGQVDCKLEAKVATRSATLTLADPRREVAIDGVSAAAGAVFYDKQIQIGIWFKGPRLGRWILIPVFCGPITEASREGWQTTITSQGKERLATGMVWEPRTYPAGSKRIDVVRDLLARAGEHPSRILTTDLPGSLPKPLALLRNDNAWTAAKGILESINRQGLYDGRGDFRTRSWPNDPKITFRGGLDIGGTMLTQPKVTYPEATSWNGVWVRGPKKPNGKRPEFTSWLPANHPLSPWARQRNGAPFRMAYAVEANSVRTVAEAREVADRHLIRLVREIVNIEVEVMPNWLLEPGDVVAFTSPALGYAEQVLKEFSLPVVGGASMVLGAVKSVSRPQRKVRKAPPRKKTRQAA